MDSCGYHPFWYASCYGCLHGGRFDIEKNGIDTTTETAEEDRPMPMKGECTMRTLKKITMLLAVFAIIASLSAPVWGEEAQPVNINTATVDELVRLERVGIKYAERIVAHREANGPFKSPEEITNVAGIGPKIYEANKDLITVK